MLSNDNFVMYVKIKGYNEDLNRIQTSFYYFYYQMVVRYQKVLSQSDDFKKHKKAARTCVICEFALNNFKRFIGINRKFEARLKNTEERKYHFFKSKSKIRSLPS